MGTPRRNQRRSIPIMLAAIGLGAGCLAVAGFARPGARTDPPGCSDSSVVNQLRQAYAAKMSLHGVRLRFRAENIRETGLGQSPRTANQFAPTRDYYGQSRYCEATLHLSVGVPDTVYFRLDGRKDGPVSDYNFDPCFPRYDTLDRECVGQRPPQHS